MIVANEADLVELIRQRLATEHRQPNLELKRSWDGKYGEKLSSLANRITPSDRWLVVGVEDNGTLAGHPEGWAEKTEKIISQHINDKLSPILACKAVRAISVDGNWIIIITMINPGDVVYWGDHAYTASGTTARVLEPPEVMELRLRLPGLTDYTRLVHGSTVYAPDLVERFAAKVRSRATGEHLPLDPGRMLSTLNVVGRQAARLLFGDCQFRVVVYDGIGGVLLNSTETSLYRLLQADFFPNLQARSGFRVSSDLYPPKGLREALANAVAHAAYFEHDGDIIIELFPDRLTISNLCTPDSKYFANRWFSRSHHTVNGLLMETLTAPLARVDP